MLVLCGRSTNTQSNVFSKSTEAETNSVVVHHRVRAYHVKQAPEVTNCLDIPARALKVEENAWLIADDHGIVSWRGNRDIARPEIVYGAIVHHCAKVSGNDVGKMCPLATLRTCDRSHML